MRLNGIFARSVLRRLPSCKCAFWSVGGRRDEGRCTVLLSKYESQPGFWCRILFVPGLGYEQQRVDGQTTIHEELRLECLRAPVRVLVLLGLVTDRSQHRLYAVRG